MFAMLVFINVIYTSIGVDAKKLRFGVSAFILPITVFQNIIFANIYIRYKQQRSLSYWLAYQGTQT